MFEFDHDIIMHRDAHFGGSFEEMLSYYENENHLGIREEFEKKRIGELAHYEKSSEKNLSTLLEDAEKKRVDEAKNAYLELKSIYEVENPKTLLPKLIADLILAEETPDTEIQKIVALGESSVPALISILKNEDSYDPLFPGYGFAPYHAILALKQIRDKRAIIPLFETIGREMVFEEDIVFSALSHQGNEAKEFLLKILKSRPITQDNIHAALALASFNDVDIKEIACQQLQDKNVWKSPFFFTYLLILAQENREKLLELKNDPSLPQSLKKEIAQSLGK